MTVRRLLCLLSIVGPFAATACYAAGYAVFTQGASALAQGNAVTAHSDSPNSVFFNPALINGLDGTQAEIGSTIIFSSHDFQSALPGGSSTSNESTFFPSTVFLTHKFNDRVSAGLGVFNPFGLGTDWGETWEGRYLATKSTLQTYDINPVISYRVAPCLTVAAGLDVTLADAALDRRLPPSAFGTVSDVGQRFSGDGVGIGFNLAAAWQINEPLSLGVSYRSQSAVKLSGQSSTSLGITPLDSHGHTWLRLPPQFTAGIAWRVNEPLTVEAGVRWEGWSAFRSQLLTLDNGTPLPPVARDWHDTLGLNVGGSYRLSDSTSLMAGYIYGADAVSDSTFDPSIPDADTHIFCIGAEERFQRFTVALAYAYQLYLDRTKNNTLTPLLPPHYADGRYQNDAHLLAVSVGYKF
jgi:long-chain fatty acid transport protein